MQRVSELLLLYYQDTCIFLKIHGKKNTGSSLYLANFFQVSYRRKSPRGSARAAALARRAKTTGETLKAASQDPALPARSGRAFVAAAEQYPQVSLARI